MPIDLVARRLANQQLSQSSLSTPAEVVSWFGAVQAQDYGAAKWAVGQRLPQATDAAVEEALTSGSILRTHVLRPTWHFVAPADIRWLLALTGPRVNAANGYHYRSLELDDAFFVRSHRVIAKALEGGNYLTRAELGMVLEKARLVRSNDPEPGQRMAHILMRAELDGIVCSGPRRQKQFTYALLAERAPAAADLSRDEALSALVLRYYTSHGPATIADFVWWSGLTMRDARAGIDQVKSRVCSETVSGQTFWMSATSTATRKHNRGAWLLPNYDEYVVGYADRKAIFPQSEPAGSGRDNPVFRHTVLFDGKVAGSWQRSIAKSTLRVATQAFSTPRPVHARALLAAVRRYGDFLGLTAELQ